LPLYADFSPALLSLTENGRILGEVVIRYSMLGKEKAAIRSAAIDVYNRNTFPAGDMAGLAAFVSPTAPEVLEFSKYVTGLARTKRRTALNSNLQFAAWLFEGLRAASIRVTGASSLTEIQYPFQTLVYRTGTVTDVGLLFAGTVEAAGIRAAIIPLGDDFITAFSLGINEASAAGLFNGLDSVLIVDDEVWLPLSMAKFNDGFIESWKAAADRLTTAFDSGESASSEAIEFIVLEDAWTVYPPAPLPAQGLRVNLPEQGALSSTAGGALDAYIRQEIQPKITVLLGQIRNTPTASLYNQLANLYVRAGNMAEGKTAFERAAGLGSVAAMINRGNLALVERDYTAAERWFKQALQIQPENATAQRGLQQIQAERNN
jgi:hypothetical protein